MRADVIKEASDKCLTGNMRNYHKETGKRRQQKLEGCILITWFVDGIRDEVLPQLCVVLLFSKFNGFVHILQLLHDHLQSPSAVSHPAWVQRYIHCFTIALKYVKIKA